MSGKEIIEKFIRELEEESEIYNKFSKEVVKSDGKSVNQKFLEGCDSGDRNNRILALFPGDEVRETADRLLFAFPRKKFELIKAALETRAKKALLTEDEANGALETVRNALKLDEHSFGFFDETINGINLEAVVLKKDFPELTEAEFSGMKNEDIIASSWTYEGPGQNGLTEDKSSDMYLVKRGDKIYIFCQKKDEEYECKEVKNAGEVAAAVQEIKPDKQGNEYLDTPNQIKKGRLVKVGETRRVLVAHPNLDDTKLKDLLAKLEGKDAIDDPDKSLLLMISEVFIANNGMSELFQRPLSLEETTDFLRFLTKGIGSMKNPTFAARIILCDQEKLNRIKTAFGVANSFASEFFQGSQHVQYTKDKFITSGPDTKFSEVPAKEGESEKEAAKKTREDGNAKREALKQEILSGNKACLYSSGAHHIGLVFGGVKDGKRQIYIQDSTEGKTQDIAKNYATAIKQFYTEKYDIIKTVQKKDAEQMFAGLNGLGIENQCRYSAIIFSERVLAEVKEGRPPEKLSIKYGQADFERKFAEWFDKSQLGQEISGPKKSPAPEVEKSKSEFVTLEYKGKAGSKAKIAQLTREQILGGVYSDHLPQVFDIKLTAPKEADEASAKESNIKILSWNVLGQCRQESTATVSGRDIVNHANNPWNHEESEQVFKDRRIKQNNFIKTNFADKGADIICLQEYTVINDAAASEKLCEELKTKLGGEWNYKFSREAGKKKLNVTFYNGAKLKVVGEAVLGLNTNDTGKPFNCATELTFKRDKQEFIVSNVHSAAYGENKKVEEYLSESQKKNLPFFAVGDFNGDANSFDKTHRPFAPNGATNFDAPLVGGIYDRRDGAEMVVQNKCYDMAFAVLPTGFKAKVKCVGRVFNEGLQSIGDSERLSSFGAPTPTKTVVKVKQSKPSIGRALTINPEDWSKKYGHIPREKNSLTDSLAKTLVENITTTAQAEMVLRAVQASVQRLEDKKSEDAATLLWIAFKKAGVSSAVQEIFFEVESDSKKTSFKKESFKDEEPNADALTNVSHLVARHLELVDPHKNLAKKLIKYQLQEIGKIKEGVTEEEKAQNSADKAYKIKTLRNLAVYLGASGESEKLAIGDRHEDSSEFVNLLLDALYETPPFRLEKTSSAVENGAICSVKNNPANTLQTELPKATIRDSGEKEFEATTFGKTIAAYQEAEILGKDLSEEVYRAEVNRRFTRLRAENELSEFDVFDTYYESEVGRGGLGEYLTSAYVAFDTTEGKKKFKTKSQFKVFVRDDVSEIVVSTKRFAFTEEGERHKLRNEVTLNPITLSIDGDTKGETKIFEPTSIIQHMGDLDGGHYISYIKEGDNKWYCYNDEERSGPIEEGALAQAQKDSYIVKYSVVGTPLPEAQAGARNLTGNMCWANAAAALTASCSSLLGEKIVLTSEEQSILDGDFARESSSPRQVSRDLLWLSSHIKTVINPETFSDHGLSEEETDILRSEQEYFLQNIKNPKAYYDFQTLNFAINADVESIRNIELVEYDAQPTHEENLNRGIARLFEDSLNLRGLAIPMRPVSDLDGTPKARDHFTGLYVTKNEEGSFGAFYIDPTGEGRVTDIPKYIMDKLEALSIDRDNIELTTNKIQHCTESRVDEVDIDGVKLFLKTDGSPTNVHCGAFIADILSGLITGEKSIQDGRIKSKTESGEEGAWQDLLDLDQTESDEEGKRIRRVHQVLLEGAPEIVIDESSVLRRPKGGRGGSDSGVDSDPEGDEESLDGSEGKLSKEIEIEGMKVSKDKKTITLSFKDSKGDKAAPITIDVKENKFLKVGDTSSGEPRVEIKSKDFRKELMKYYLSGPGKNEEARTKYEAPEEKVDVVGKDVLEVLNIYRAVPSTSIAARSASKVIVGDLIRGR